MALGFGFNKAKVLASAEKFVQQGKLQNAIAEYEKIVKEDPKDLTVLNTLGDLCARVGQNEQALQYFKKVGDHYAQDGFTVKAIAVYKKLTRLSPNNQEHLNRLGELYSQQGLFTDARAQYMQVADHLLKAGDNNQAARALQKILELDPENTATQSKLADLYLKLGKKTEACKIYYTAAESLYARASFDAADEALGRVLSIDADNSAARLLRGMIASAAGDSASAIQHLELVPDLDSRPNGLRALLHAKLQAGAGDGAESLATKLATVHNDLSGISSLAQWYVANQQFAKAVKLYDAYSDRFMAGDRAAFEASIHPLISRVRDDPEALNAMARLLQRMGDSSHSAEIMELQAHTSAQKGDFKAARDLYKKLADLEPDNPLHNQNHRQMLSKLGEDPATRTLAPHEASQAFMVEELEQGVPGIHQSYDPPTERAIEAALTDAELFVSYNVPGKAIPPLEAVLPLAPRDVTVNQRLAALYARSGRYADAARACQILSEVYREQGHGTESSRYLEASKNYASRAPESPVVTAAPAAAPPPAAVVLPVEETAAPALEVIDAARQPALEVEIPTEQPVASVQEFSFDVPDQLLEEAHAAAQTDTQPIPIETISAPETRTEIAPGEAEFDVSNEWESMLTVDSAEIPAGQTKEVEVSTTGNEDQVEAEIPVDPAVAAAEKIQEARFYISQQMWDAAKKAILDLTEIAPDALEITDLISAVSAGQSRAAAAAAPTPAVPAPAAAVVSPPRPVKPTAMAPPVPAPEPPPPVKPTANVPRVGESVIGGKSKEAALRELHIETEPQTAAADEFVVEVESAPDPVPEILRVSEPEPAPPATPERKAAPEAKPAPESKPAAKTAAALALEEIFRAPAGPPPTAPQIPSVPAPAPTAAPPAPPPAPPPPKPQPVSPPAIAAEAAPPAPQPEAIPRRPAQPVTPAASVAMPAVVAAPGIALEELLLEDIPPAPVEAARPAAAEALEIGPPPVQIPSPAMTAPPAASTPEPSTWPTATASAATAQSTAAIPGLDPLLEDVLDFEAEFAPPPNVRPPAVIAAPEPPQPPPARPAVEPAQQKPKEKSAEDILADFVSDMEKSDLADFVPRAKPDAPPPPAEPAMMAAPETPAPAILEEIEEEEEGDGDVLASPPPTFVELPVDGLAVAPATAVTIAAANGDMHDAESASVLTDILSELQQESAEESESEEDPETHYNLGIAFKEMGLLDEAIGELQKVCHSMDRGHMFSQPIQAYTWLAQCLVDKGAPEAAVRWYKRALQLPRLDDGSRCAIYYDLALAYEAYGDKKSALANLMEVYGSNIDFRDVASRIKALKS